MNQYQEVFYPESAFGGFTDVDGTIAFYVRVNALATTQSTVVDFGCGRGAHAYGEIPFKRALASLKGKVNLVIGLDIDSTGSTNPAIDDFRQLTDNQPWPIPSRSADLIICDNVIEHLPNPSQFFSEAARTLKSGGFICIRTPNVLSYFGIASMLIPASYHHKILPRVQDRRESHDVFPTLYRCNTVSKMRTLMNAHGFRSTVYGHEAEPSYLRFSKIAYWLGVLHQRYAPRLIRPTIFAFGKLTRS